MGVGRGVRVVRARSPAVSRARALPHCGRPLAGGSRKPPAHRGELRGGEAAPPGPQAVRAWAGLRTSKGRRKPASSPGQGAMLPPRTAPAASRRSAGRGRPLPGRPWHRHPLRASPRVPPPPGTSPVGALPAQSGSPAERAPALSPFRTPRGKRDLKTHPNPSRRLFAAAGLLEVQPRCAGFAGHVLLPEVSARAVPAPPRPLFSSPLPRNVFTGCRVCQ